MRTSHLSASRTGVFQRCTHVRVVPGGLLLNFAEGGQRNRRVQIVGNFVVIVEIGKNQDREIKPRKVRQMVAPTRRLEATKTPA